MSITRRHLAVAGVLALGGVGLLRGSAAVAESADEAAVAQAVEALRKAILGQEKTQLEALAAEQMRDGLLTLTTLNPIVVTTTTARADARGGKTDATLA